jgi:hypothetical protein
VNKSVIETLNQEGILKFLEMFLRELIIVEKSLSEKRKWFY